MLYVATVHHHDEKWIDVQRRYLDRHLTEPFRVFGSLEGIDPARGERFDRVVPSRGPHAGKLNLLAAEVCAEARSDDLLMFLDGDAFPIADPMPTVREALASAALVAVQRLENAGDPQPHPSFCVTTVGTWQALGGDWSEGHTWIGADGPTTDVGGNLLRLLELAGLGWAPLHRTNAHDLHPLWFGVYGGVVYHHGAGFRRAISREDLRHAPVPLPSPSIAPVRRVVRKVDAVRRRRWEAQLTTRAARLSDQMFVEARDRFDFHQQLT